MNIRLYICGKYRLSTIIEKMVYLFSGSFFPYYDDLWLHAYFVLQAKSLVLYPFLACVCKSIYVYVCVCMRACACLCLSFSHICSPDGQHLGGFCPLVTVKSAWCLCSMLTESPPGTYRGQVWLMMWPWLPLCIQWCSLVRLTTRFVPLAFIAPPLQEGEESRSHTGGPLMRSQVC